MPGAVVVLGNREQNDGDIETLPAASASAGMRRPLTRNARGILKAGVGLYKTGSYSSMGASTLRAHFKLIRWQLSLMAAIDLITTFIHRRLLSINALNCRR